MWIRQQVHYVHFVYKVHWVATIRRHRSPATNLHMPPVICQGWHDPRLAIQPLLLKDIHV